MLPDIGSLTTGDIPGNIGNGGPSQAGGSASASNALAGINFGGMNTEDYLLIGVLVLVGLVIWKKG
ncbi:hypothetical protein [Endozoicomonas sp.]|uniref:hypothetical protein n=1 Tax=Endozoicomonas sp. TaxID=1892382 RepID=UPI003AF6B64D